MFTLGLTLWAGEYGALILTGKESAEQERQRAEHAEPLLAQQRQRAERLAALLRQAGLDPDRS